jgi:hypothetical protein
MGPTIAIVNTQTAINCMHNEINSLNIQPRILLHRSICPPARAASQHPAARWG